MNHSTGKEIQNGSALFSDLFVLELANNHWGSVERGKEIIRQHGRIVQEEGVKAAVKFQFRDVDTFVHDAFKPHEDIAKEGEVVQAPGSSSRYIKKTIATKLTPAEFAELLAEVRAFGMLTMATPFDEKSVQWCADLDIDIVKIASQDAKSWVLVERIAELGKPTIISNGGTDIADLDRVVKLFEKKKVPLAINHCVSLYPSEDIELELNQVDYLKHRYPGHIIGYSTHEYHDWSSSVQVTYAKGARTWERHVDIEDAEGTPVSKYCSLPHQVRTWFQAFKKAKEMSGTNPDEPRLITEKEREYVQSVSRGAYALRDLPAGTVIGKSDVGTEFEFVIPLQGAQLSSRDLDADVTLQKNIKKGDPIFITDTSVASMPAATPVNRTGFLWALGDGTVRAFWVGVLMLLAVLTGLWIVGVWALLASAAVAIVAGVTLALKNQYELYPSLRQASGGVLIGFLSAGTILSVIGMVHLDAPYQFPFLMLAGNMVMTALVTRIRSWRSGVHSLIAWVLFVTALTLPAYFYGLSVWLLLGYAFVAAALVEQVVIRVFNTGVLLPWVQLLWSGVGVLIATIAATAWLVQNKAAFVHTLISAPMSVGLLAMGAAVLSAFAVLTRVKMRMSDGALMHKRLVVLGIVSAAGLIVAPTIFPFAAGASALLVILALFVGDRNA